MMMNRRRLAVALVGVWLAFAWAGLFFSGPAAGQAKIEMKKEIQVKGTVAVPTKTGDGTTLSSQYSAVKLSENTTFRGYLNAARACVLDKDWKEAVTAVQLILDSQEDFYARIEEVGPDGNKAQRWTSVKFEAN